MDEKNMIEVIIVEPGKEARTAMIGDDLKSMQSVVEGMIEEYMPFEDDVAVVCNDEGKIMGMPLNRAVMDEDGQVMDIICGPFFICYAPPFEESFQSLPENLKEKYLEKFRYPEKFSYVNGHIKPVTFAPGKNDLAR